MDTVINLRHEPALRDIFEHTDVHDNTVLIDRRTRWGNMFHIGPDGTRRQVVAQYRAYLWLRIRETAQSLLDSYPLF